MTAFVHAFETAAGDTHQQLIDTVHERGSSALTSILGDLAFFLTSLATQPGGLFEPGAGEASEYARVIGQIQGVRCAFDALDARAIVALADTLKRDRHADALVDAAQEAEAVPSARVLDKQAERTAAREVSMITRRSPATAGRTLASCRRLVEDMPSMFTALATGKVTTDVAHAASRSLAPLSPLQRDHADQFLGERLPYLDAAGKKQWRSETAAAIEQADPYGQKRRHQHAKQDRHVTVRPGEHGMATISAHIPSLDAAKIRKRLSLEAERLRADGDKRGHQAIQADALIATLLGQEGAIEPITLDIGVMITDRALFTPGVGDIAHIEGYGPVPAEAVREELRDALSTRADQMDDALGPDGPALRAVLRRLYTHPTTGELVGVESHARAFPKALARFIVWRDVTCRGPFCDAPIRQTDHIRPHAAGGHTCLDNGEGTCAFCNDKEQQVAGVERVIGTAGHQVTWTSYTGITRTTAPEALTRPGPDAIRDGDPAAVLGLARRLAGERRPRQRARRKDRRRTRSARRQGSAPSKAPPRSDAGTL